MQGEYRGDFTRDTFYPANHFCRVLMQQGRVQLDADWNEQAAILLYYLRSLAGDLIGQHGGPVPAGFAVTPVASGTQPISDLNLSPGHYYVDGILCELDSGTTASYHQQPAFPNPPAIPPGTDAIVYLDIWERHLTSAQQDQIREVALGGPDTASRAQIVWQLKLLASSQDSGFKGASIGNLFQTLQQQADTAQTDTRQKYNIADGSWREVTDYLQTTSGGQMAARVQPQNTSTNPCVISPQSAYRGTENQLYRVEIHTGGNTVWSGKTDSSTGKPADTQNAVTFKFSRENGSVVFPILQLGTTPRSGTVAAQTTVVLANLGPDRRLSLNVNDWVEILDDDSDLAVSGQSQAPGSLLQVQAVDPATMTVTLVGTTAVTVDQPPTKHPLLRRWDQQPGDGKTSNLILDSATGAVLLQTGAWLTLEDGIQIQFPATQRKIEEGQTHPLALYRPGDYWLIPARVATGGIEWPQTTDRQGNQTPAAQPPHGIEHHYAPLAYLGINNRVVDLRRTYDPLAK